MLPYVEELEKILSLVSSENVRIDCSVINDMRYYNGVTFKGFIAGVPGSVLSGGQYDALMRRMHRKDGAIGFAVYLDMLERLEEGGAANG